MILNYETAYINYFTIIIKLNKSSNFIKYISRILNCDNYIFKKMTVNFSYFLYYYF